MQDFFNYHLPKEKIAQSPVSLKGERSDARLVHASFENQKLIIKDSQFSDIISLFCPDDLLILNDTKVLPVRFFVKDGMEIFLLERTLIDAKYEEWLALARPMKKFNKGEIFQLSKSLNAEVLGRDDTSRKLRLRIENLSNSIIEDILYEEGMMPIPSYIREGRAEDFDKELYQTVYAKNSGSVAAPTAGLHFTKEILEEIGSKGVSLAYVTLHVGFASILAVENIVGHKMQYERYLIPSETVNKIKQAKKENKRIIAVGTTCARALESMAVAENFKSDQLQETNLFITPGFDFKIIDALFTNFHQPQSTHLLLVAALMGEDNIAKIYNHALGHDYRFLSYGDTMLLDPKGK